MSAHRPTTFRVGTTSMARIPAIREPSARGGRSLLWAPSRIVRPPAAQVITEWRPDLAGDPGMANPGPDGWVNPNAFAVPQNADGTYRFGNLGRNTLLGPGYFNLDAGLMKDFRLGATRRLQFRWEVFNATNHPSYGLPNSILGDPDFGTIRTTISTPRQMQFGM